jgi:hypothetical protein
MGKKCLPSPQLWNPHSLIYNVNWVLFPLGVKRPGYEADHSPPSNADVIRIVKPYLHLPMCFQGIVHNFLNPGTNLSCRLSCVSLFVVNLHSGGWSPNWVHSALRPFTGLLYLARVIVRMENLGGMNGRGNRSTRRKSAPAPLCPPQIPLEQTQD